MPVKHLSPDASRSVLVEAVKSALEVVVISGRGRSWLTFKSHVLELSSDRMRLLLPQSHQRLTFEVGQMLGLNLRLGSAKYVFGAHVLSCEHPVHPLAMAAPTITLALPVGGRKITNRVFERVPVPFGKRATAMFWPGGLDLPPVDNSPETPVWFGDLVDLSVGGFGVRSQRDVQSLLHPGDIVGVSISFDDLSSFSSDAHLCHVIDSSEPTLGFRFCGLESTPHGRVTIDLIEQQLRRFAAA